MQLSVTQNGIINRRSKMVLFEGLIVEELTEIKFHFKT